MSEITGSSEELSPSEVAAELVRKAALLKQRTAKLKEKMEITQQEVTKALNPDNDNKLGE